MFEEVERVRLVFVDGVFAPELSDAPELAGVEIEPLAVRARAPTSTGRASSSASWRRAARTRSTGRSRR